MNLKEYEAHTKILDDDEIKEYDLKYNIHVDASYLADLIDLCLIITFIKDEVEYEIYFKGFYLSDNLEINNLAVWGMSELNNFNKEIDSHTQDEAIVIIKDVIEDVITKTLDTPR